MYSLGMATIFMYLGSLASFLLGVQFTNLYILAFGVGTVLFIIATIILLGMMRKRADKQDF